MVANRHSVAGFAALSRRRGQVFVPLLGLLLAACGGSSGATTTIAGDSTTTSATATSLVDPAEELAAAMTAISQTDCVLRTPLGDIVQFGPDEQLFDLIGAVTTDGVSRTGVPIFRPTNQDLEVVGYTTAGPTDAGRLHAEIMFSQMRTVVILSELANEPGDPIVYSTLESAEAKDEATRYATWVWEAGVIDYADADDPFELSPSALLHWHSTLRFPEYQLSEPALAAAWDAVDAWLVELGEAVDIYRDADPATVAAELEPVTVDLDSTTALLCAILATEGQRSEDDPSDREAVLTSLATEELLLATEYLGVISDAFESEDVQWLRGDGATLTVVNDGVTSHAEQLRVWQHAIDFSIYLHALYRSQPVVTNPPPAIPQAAGLP